MAAVAAIRDPLSQGARVRIIAGEHAGKTGTIIRAYRGRPCGLDRIYVEIDGGPVGWSVAFKVEDLEAVR
ncbi:MAG: 50S ribosomal protein L24 [Bosea sp.]|uniref:KOW motif domain-containing protein n=1 Tax=Bosea sp. (in: a-proteobacteria) TaxID=1871050 RepID=UPI001AC852D1|nr:KOW motif domain-containing protein [Bosea sp. (in: a-proteobacteria)]MBN9472285.1 50S ribosomal protein L24 [Bosea sp. (in: a-proteobacteria)]